MKKRLQEINGDKILEITESQPVKVRLSLKDLERKKAYLVGSIAKFEGELEDTLQKIQMIHAETPGNN